ncbi:MAG: sulfurtransferase TusA family protein [Candidatus Eisenbacteria bacterium]|jgi:TusA-related sulfurtransferase|nr:sulfurtransferase TusA family protein [Candidatus Eisenbacteria bacterium]
MKAVDARGLSCPQPVILTRRAIENGQFPIEVLVDTVTARENVRRMAEKAGCTVTMRAAGDDIALTISR